MQEKRFYFSCLRLIFIFLFHVICYTNSAILSLSYFTFFSGSYELFNWNVKLKLQQNAQSASWFWLQSTAGDHLQFISWLHEDERINWINWTQLNILTARNCPQSLRCSPSVRGRELSSWNSQEKNLLKRSKAGPEKPSP